MERCISLEDRANLPYTEAVIMESMRFASLVPQAMPHGLQKDVSIGGYDFPKVFSSFKLMNYNYAENQMNVGNISHSKYHGHSL